MVRRVSMNVAAPIRHRATIATTPVGRFDHTSNHVMLAEIIVTASIFAFNGIA